MKKSQFVCFKRKGKLFYLVQEESNFFFGDKEQLDQIELGHVDKIKRFVADGKAKVIGTGHVAQGLLFKKPVEREVI